VRSLKDDTDQSVFIISCDLCEQNIGTERPNAMGTPTNNLSEGVITISTGVNDIDICPSCRYAGAVDLVNVIRVSTVTQQLRQTGSTASKILMHKDIAPQAKHAARMVIIDLQLCVEQLKKVSVAIERLGY